MLQLQLSILELKTIKFYLNKKISLIKSTTLDSSLFFCREALVVCEPNHALLSSAYYEQLPCKLRRPQPCRIRQS